jgi:hypothetical protein
MLQAPHDTLYPLPPHLHAGPRTYIQSWFSLSALLVGRHSNTAWGPQDSTCVSFCRCPQQRPQDSCRWCKWTETALSPVAEAGGERKRRGRYIPLWLATSTPTFMHETRDQLSLDTVDQTLDYPYDYLNPRLSEFQPLAASIAQTSKNWGSIFAISTWACTLVAVASANGRWVNKRRPHPIVSDHLSSVFTASNFC